MNHGSGSPSFYCNGEGCSRVARCGSICLTFEIGDSNTKKLSGPFGPRLPMIYSQIYMSVCLSVCMHDVWMCMICMYVCMHVCMCFCMYDMYTYSYRVSYIYIYIWRIAWKIGYLHLIPLIDHQLSFFKLPALSGLIPRARSLALEGPTSWYTLPGNFSYNAFRAAWLNCKIIGLEPIHRSLKPLVYSVIVLPKASFILGAEAFKRFWSTEIVKVLVLRLKGQLLEKKTYRIVKKKGSSMCLDKPYRNSIN